MNNLIILAIATGMSCFLLCMIVANAFEMKDRNIGIIAIVGVCITFSLFVCGIVFHNTQHMLACMKYDNVVALKYRVNDGPAKSIDESKVVFQEDEYGDRFVIMAWDDKPADKYEQLVKAE